MGAARMVMTMAVLAIGGGGLLAIATIPALAPYRQGKPDRASAAILAPDRLSNAGAGILPDASAPAASAPGAYGEDYSLAPSPRQERDEGQLGTGDGGIVIELPRWTRGGGEWLSLGHRAWHDWVDPGDSDSAATFDERRYRPSDRRRWDDGEDAARQDYGRNPDRRWREEQDENDYGYQDRRSWSPEPPLPPAAQAPDAFTDRRSQEPRAARPDSPTDAAGNAAERARQAARDVRAAEGVH